MAYIIKGSDAVTTNKESLKHEKAKQPWYAKWRLGFDIYNSMYGDKFEVGGLEYWRTLSPVWTDLLSKPQIINQIVPWVKYMSGVMTQATFTKLVPEVYTDQNAEQVKIWDDSLWHTYKETNLFRDIYLGNILRFTIGDGSVLTTWDMEDKQDCNRYAKWVVAREDIALKADPSGDELTLLEEEWDPEKNKRQCLCTGALNTKVRSGIDIIPNQEALTDKKMDWFLERERVSLAKAQDVFGQKGPYFLGGAMDLGLMKQADIEGQGRTSGGLSPVLTFYEPAECTTTILEKRWKKADNKNPRGRLTVTGMNAEVPLYDGPLPYNQVHRLPLHRFTYEPVPGCYWSNTNGFRAILPQLDQNHVLSKFKKVIDNHALAKPCVDKSAGITEDFTNDDEDILEYNGEALAGRPPAYYMTFPNPSRIYTETMEKYKEEVANVLNFHGMHAGQIPPQLRSTPQMNIALEETNKQIRPIAECDVYTYNTMYKFILHLMAENKPDSFFEKFTGKNRGRYMYSLATTFRSVIYDVHTEVRSVFDMSIYMKTERLKELIPFGLIRPDEIEELRKILAETGGGFDTLEELNRPGEINAYDENERFVAEGILNDYNNQPFPYENHRSHLRIHSKQVEAAKFRDIAKQGGVQAVQVFFQHMDLHKGAIMEAQAEAAEMNQMQNANVGTQPANKQAGGEVAFGEAGAPE